MEEKLTQEQFEAKCKDIREDMNAESVWNSIRSEIPMALEKESTEFIKELRKLKGIDNIDEYAQHLYDLTASNISEDEALELTLAGEGKMVCDVKKVVDR